MTNHKDSNTIASEKFESSQQHAKRAVDTTAAAARELAGAARSVVQSAYREGKEELTAAARDVRHAARATCSSLAEQTATMTDHYRERACELEEELTEYVREKPLHAVGIAFGVGLFLGVLLNRK